MQRVLVYGTDGVALPALEALLGAPDIEVVGVVTKPDRPAGRGQKMQRPPILDLVPEGVPVFQPTRLTPELLEELRALNPDIGLVVVYGKIIPTEFLELPARGTWNIHPSLLPKYRGPSPIVSPILYGDSKTGVSIMLLDDEMDHGPVFAQEVIPIEPSDTAETLFDKLAEISGPLLLDTIKRVVEDGLEPQEQDHDAATYCGKFSKDDWELDFTQPADLVERKVRAFPGKAWFTLPNGKRCKVFAASTTEKPDLDVGKGECTKTGCVIACGKNGLQLDSVRVEGKATMDAKAFANGYKSLF